MNFEQAEEYVSSLLKFGVNLGLERVENYLQQKEYPWDNIKFIHVGGTNGKGSTAAMLAAILGQSGRRVGLYSSPHINNYCERISINGDNIPQQFFAEIVSEIALAMNIVSNKHQLTEFEVLTVLAFEYFRREKVYAAVMEVGMGGRFDATNIIPCPAMSVITNISKDHMQYLGYSTLDIAVEKAGIIKANGCLVTAEQSPEIRSTFKNKCTELGAAFHFVGDEVEWRQEEVRISQGFLSQECSLKSAAFELKGIRLKMLGLHQIVNASTALLGAQVLLEKGLNISPQHVRNGLESVSIPGRFEVLHHNPLVILDAAHNVEGMLALKETISSIAGDKKLILVTGMLDDKEHEKIAGIWGQMPSGVVVTKPDSLRSGTWEQLAHCFSRYLGCICLIEDIQKAITRGWELAGDNGILCVTGSFYLLKRSRQQLQVLMGNG